MSEFLKGVQQGAAIAQLRNQMQLEESRLREMIADRLQTQRYRDAQLQQEQAYNTERLANQDQYYQWQMDQEQRRFLAEQGKQSKAETDRINKEESEAIGRLNSEERNKRMFERVSKEDYGTMKPEDQAMELAKIAMQTGDAEAAAKYAIAAKTSRARGETSQTKAFLFKDPDTEQVLPLPKEGYINATKSAIDRLKLSLRVKQGKKPSGKTELKAWSDEVQRLESEIELRKNDLNRVMDGGEPEEPSGSGKSGGLSGMLKTPSGDVKWELDEE